MTVEAYAQTWMWPSEREDFIAYCRRRGTANRLVFTAEQFWAEVHRWHTTPKPPRVYHPAPEQAERRMFIPRIERPMCSNCNAPVSRHGAIFCMACTFPHEREKRRRQRGGSGSGRASS